MRQLLPSPVEDVDPADVYGRMAARPDGRPAVRVNMVESVDGAATRSGRSGGLSGPADKALFRTLRAAADVVLVGAGTVRAERYGPVRLGEDQISARVAAGLEAVPPIAVLTGSGHLDLGSALFCEAQVRPVVVTVESADRAQLARVSEVADVVVAGTERVDLGVALAALGDRGWSNVLAEGGPSVVGQLLAADLVDELCVTTAPLVVGGGAARIVHGAPVEPPPRLRLLALLEEGEFLFARYGRDETSAP
jgi:riboflavin-specific deaminase-like protein